MSFAAAPLLFVIALLLGPGPGTAQGAELRVGGTGAALGTMRVLLEAFSKTEPELSARVLPSLGSSGGIKAVLGGAIDLAVSARAPKGAEAAAGAVAVMYGTTAVVLAVAHENPTLGLSSEQLLEIYRGTTRRWPDGTAVRLVLRPSSETDSKLLEGYLPDSQDVFAALRDNPAIPIAYTDQQSADQIEATPGALGTSTLSLIHAERRPLRALQLDGVTADERTIADGSYPLTKSFFLVSKGRPEPLVDRFIGFVRSPDGQALLRRTGHLPATG